MSEHGTTYLERAKDLAEVIDTNAAKSDGPVADESIRAMVDAGLYTSMAPREVGGAELTLTENLDVFAEISRADGSTGWCLMASCGASAYFASWCPDSFVEREFSDGVPLVAGQFAPAGTAVPVEGGYQLTGKYQFGSGMNDASYAGAGAFTAPTDGSNPGYRFFIMPKEQVQLKGNWNVLGLTGTASWDYEVEDVFIPEDATFDFFDITRHRGGPIYDLGVMPLTALGHAAWAIGLTRRAIDELVSIAQAKQRLGAPSTLVDSEHVVMEVAKLEARFRAAKAWVYNSFAAAEAQVNTGDTPDPALSLDCRMATVHVTSEAADIIRGAYLLAGTTALRDGALQRCFRDIHAGTQHAMVSPNITREFGTDVLGTTA
jgi:alkylation response protein AidB-like acyl-CoA dehydrogenase